jgi:uncharacterized protein (TIGR00730 family)
MKGVCVLCGAQRGLDPRHFTTAAELGTRLAQHGIPIVYGGSTGGCMGALADAALAAGGTVIGVRPAFLMDSERRHGGLTRLEAVPDLAARKVRMFELSSAVIILPGGTGTFAEFLEAMTMKRLGLLRHQLIVVDTRDYFAPMLALFRAMITSGFAEPEHLTLLHVVDSPAAAVELLQP